MRSHASWSEAPVHMLGALPPAAGAHTSARVVRLDALLDQFDAARFTGEEDLREDLWQGLGGHRVGQGPAATRDALTRLLEEALALEKAQPEISGGPSSGPEHEEQRFVADAIMLLTTDLEQPTDPESLATRTLAYRELFERGHPRLQDNAAWRLYDHARATLARATEVPAMQRFGVAAQTLYVEREDVGPYLDDTSAHRPRPVPEASALWQRVDRYTEVLERDPRWADVVARRRAGDQALAETVLASLPAARDPQWPMPEVERGTGQRESLAPVLIVTPRAVIVDAGRPQARTLPLSEAIEPVADRIAETLAQDGRGTLLLVLDPQLPAPELAHAFRAIRRAQTSRLEVALREPHDAEHKAVVALPLDVARSADAGAGARAIIESRLAVHLTGHGAQFFFDDRALEVPASTRAMAEQIERLRQAFPREARIRLTLGSDVAPDQLVDLLAALVGSASAVFEAVGWWAGGGASPQAVVSPRHAEVLSRRAALRWSRPHVDIVAPEVSTEDDVRLRNLAKRLFDCVPELETPLPAARLTLELQFTGGRLTSVQAAAKKPKLPPARVAALATCVQEEALGFRLHQQAQTAAITVVLSDVGR